MRVAVVAETFWPKVDGVARSVCVLLEHLRARGHAALVFAPGPGPDRYGETRVVRVPGVPFPLYPEVRLALGRAHLRDTLACFAPDVVHVASPAVLGARGVTAARRLGVPAIAAYQTDLAAFARLYHLRVASPLLWSWLRRVHNRAVLTVAPSRAACAELGQHRIRPVALWARGVDAEAFHPRFRSAAWREAHAPGAGVVVLFVGRLAREKQIERLRPVLGDLRCAHLVIVGDGPHRAALERNFAGTATTFTGYLHGADLSTAYASADVFAHPGTTETFGQVLQEAMAAGLAVAAPARAGAFDILSDGRTGVLYEPYDDVALRAAVSRLADDPALRARLGGAARAVAETRTWAANLDDLLDLYEQLVGDSHAGRRTPVQAA